MSVFLLGLWACTFGLAPTHSSVSTGDSGAPDSGRGGGDCDDSDADNDGFDECGGDCDDSDPYTHPGAAAQDSSTDCMTDNDEDGYGEADPAGGVTPGSDCDDLNPNRSPGADETPFDGVDSDCDGEDGGVTVEGSGDPNVSISDNQTSVSTATVSGCAEIVDILVGVEIIHTWIGDLTVTLSSPTGTSAVLHNGTGSSQQDIVGTYAPGNAGSLTSTQLLDRFIGEPGSGTWRLSVRDDSFSDDGRIAGWSVVLDCY